MTDTPYLRCHWVRLADGEEMMIPGCYGTAISGPHACTCDVPGSRIERAEDLIREMHERHERLRGRLEVMRAAVEGWKSNLRSANAELAALRRRLAMIESAQ